MNVVHAAIEELSVLDESKSGGGGTSMTISDCASILEGVALGDSISVNGTCLTVTEYDGTKSFKVGVSPETLRRTNLGRLRRGDKVNLERAVSATTRMGGHFVQGHVDCVARILSVTPDGNSLVFRLSPRPVGSDEAAPAQAEADHGQGDRPAAPGRSSVMRYIVEKGYVTLDGASLTVTNVNDDEGWFEIMLIAYTQERIVTGAKTAGDEVNLETDITAKYVEKSVLGYFDDVGRDRAGAQATPAVLEKMVATMVEAKLRDLRT